MVAVVRWPTSRDCWKCESEREYSSDWIKGGIPGSVAIKAALIAWPAKRTAMAEMMVAVLKNIV